MKNKILERKKIKNFYIMVKKNILKIEKFTYGKKI